MDIILGLLRVASVFVSFGEGVCNEVGHVSASCVFQRDGDCDYDYPAMKGHHKGNINPTKRELPTVNTTYHRRLGKAGDDDIFTASETQEIYAELQVANLPKVLRFSIDINPLFIGNGLKLSVVFPEDKKKDREAASRVVKNVS